MAKGKTLNIAPPTTVDTVVAHLTGQDLSILRQVIYGTKRMNPSMVGSQVKWITKNEKKLEAAFQKHILREQEIIDRYCDKASTGEVIFWDGYDEPLNQDMKPVQEGEKQQFGYKVFVKGNQFFDAATGEQSFPPHRNFIPYAADPETRQKMTDEVNALQDEKYEVYLYQLEESLSENLRIPTMVATNPTKQIEVPSELLSKIINLGEEEEN